MAGLSVIFMQQVHSVVFGHLSAYAHVLCCMVLSRFT